MKYEKYKDSGIEWIGKIPEYWKLIKIKNYCSFIFTGGTPDRENHEFWNGDINWIPSGFCKDKEIYFADQTITKKGLDNSSTKLVYKNTPILAMTGGTCGMTGYLKISTCINQSITAYIVNESLSNSRFLWYLIQSFKDEIKSLKSGGAQGGVNLENCRNIVVPFIEKKQQEYITRYLDFKTLRVDSIIKSLEDQREKLETYKREIIAEAVTKGLDKNAEMKDSGVDWIGKVPDHWKIERIKWNFEIVKRQIGRKERPVLSITQKGIKIKDIDSNDGQMAESYEKYQLVEVGDFAMNSMDLLTGWIDCSVYEGVTSPDYRVFRLSNTNNHIHKYFNYLFQMCYTRKIFYRLGQGVSNLGRWRLQREPFLNIEIPIPPKEEQQEISDYISLKETEINNIKDELQLQIEKLKEYRKIIIHDAVTGKIKVAGGEA